MSRMIRVLTGDLYTIPDDVPLCPAEIGKWWCESTGEKYSSRVHVIEDDEKNLFHLLVSPRAVVHLSADRIEDDLTAFHRCFDEHCVNESILTYFAGLDPPERIPWPLFANSHAIVMERFLHPDTIAMIRTICEICQAESTPLLAIARNRDQRLATLFHAETRYLPKPLDDSETDIQDFLRRPYLPRLSTLFHFRTPDDRVVAHMWKGLTENASSQTRPYRIFMELPVVPHPSALLKSLILCDFDRLALYRYPFVCMCQDEEILTRCVAASQSHSHVGLGIMSNPHATVVEWILATLRVKDCEVFWSTLVANPHPAIVDFAQKRMSLYDGAEFEQAVDRLQRSARPSPELMMWIIERWHELSVSRKLKLSWVFAAFARTDDVELVWENENET